MTGNELIALFKTEEFRAELTLISSALASITHEGPIKHAVAKLLYRATRDYALEDKHRDLLIQGTHVEFKFNFDKSCVSIEKAIKRWPTLPEMWAVYKSNSRSLSPLAKLYEDIAGKNHKHDPDIFVWIVCSRDLEGIKEAELSKRRVYIWKEQRKYNQESQVY